MLRAVLRDADLDVIGWIGWTEEADLCVNVCQSLIRLGELVGKEREEEEKRYLNEQIM